MWLIEKIFVRRCQNSLDPSIPLGCDSAFLSSLWLSSICHTALLDRSHYLDIFSLKLDYIFTALTTHKKASLTFDYPIFHVQILTTPHRCYSPSPIPLSQMLTFSASPSSSPLPPFLPHSPHPFLHLLPFLPLLLLLFRQFRALVERGHFSSSSSCATFRVCFL